MKKKLVYIVNVDWFFISHRLPLALHAVKEGWDVYLLTKDTGRKEELERQGIKVYDVPFGRTSVNPVEELKCVMMSRHLLKKIKPDVIHNVTWKGCLWGGIAAKMTGNRHVVNALSGLGSVFINKGLVNRIIGYLTKVAFKNDYAAFIFQNPDDVSWFKSLGYATDNRIHIIKGSGIDLKSYAYKEALPKNKLKVLFPARMLRDKGLCELIEAFKILRPKYEEKIELILAGSCSDANKTSVSEKELKGMTVEGYITWIGNQIDMYPVYVESDIVALPSYREGLPKALIEACAVGRPIVTTDVPGCRECVEEGVNGYMVPLKSTEELAEAIAKLVEDPAARKRFGEASRQKAEREFSIENVIEKTFGIYEQVMTKAS